MMAAYEDTSFTPLEIIDEPIRREDRSVTRAGHVVYSGEKGFEVAIPQDVVNRLVLLGEQAAPHEWYGLLVGRLYKDKIGQHVVILGVVPDPDADAKPAFVRTSFDSELRTRTSARLLFPDGIPVGWVHGHVRYGARYSSTDFKNQATWTRPHSIGIVVDPFCEPRLGVYRGPEGELLSLVQPLGTVAMPVKPSTEDKGVLSASPPVATNPARHRSRLSFTAISAFLALAAIAVLVGHTIFFHWRVAGLERRTESLEEALRKSLIPRHVPSSVDGLATRQVEFADSESMCVAP